MVLNAAVQILREADELKLKIQNFKSGVSMLQERSLWTTQQQLQKVYQKVLVLDLDYALDKKVEQDLWNIGFKQQIEALQAISKDRKNPRRSEGQAMLTWVLQAAAGFYLCLLHQICTAFKLDLPFRRRASLLGWVEGWGAGEGDAAARLPPPAAARYICQHCLVHLGDLARYRQQLRVAHTFYRHALLVSAHSGQPYNQLALVAWRRGRRLGALYWHVRSLLVRAPFPPAPANLARTLAAAAAHQAVPSHGARQDLPVLPGVTPLSVSPAPVSTAGARLDAHSFVDELIRAYHMIHTLENLESATQLVNHLNSSLSALVATDSFESLTLIKMACVSMWLVHWGTEELALEAGALSADEALAAGLGASLVAGALVALLLPTYTLPEPPANALPALKVYLEWLKAHPQLLRHAAFVSRPQLWPALAHTLNALATSTCSFPGHLYDTVPLPEDEELHGFLPLEQSFENLKFSNLAAWDTYGERIPPPEPALQPQLDDRLLSEDALSSDPELEGKLRRHRLLQLGVWFTQHLKDTSAEYLRVCTEEELLVFSAGERGGAAAGGELATALAELARACADTEPDTEPLPPIVISEADFREKVREKRVGILKPQGSLERAREERALAAATQDSEQPVLESTVVVEEELKPAEEGRKESAKRLRMNVAMAAIMRKQEESSKQVKFVTPATTPDSTLESTEVSPAKDQEKTKIVQPKATKSLANLPLGRKKGGILSLKDKSAGYPHLVNADPDPPVKKSEKPEESKRTDGPSPKLSQGQSQNSQTTNYSIAQHPKPRLETQHPQAPSAAWNNNIPGAPPTLNSPYSEGLRMNYPQQKVAYGLQNAGVNAFNPVYPQNIGNVSNQGIRLPVVNPKEIDVRSAALQKQNSRQELFQDGVKFGNQNWQPSNDKKAFLNDLPPRFANQFRNWQGNQRDNQFNTMPSQEMSKFRDDNFKANNNSLFGVNNIQSSNTHPNWLNPPPITQENLTQQPFPWWKPENGPTNFNANYSAPSMNLPPNYYSQPPLSVNMASPYQNVPTYSHMPAQGPGYQIKPGDSGLNTMGSSYMQSGIGQPHMQNLIPSPNLNSSLSSFGNFSQNVAYDSAMYPQFVSNKLGYQQPTMKMSDKPMGQFQQQGKDPLMDLGHGLGISGNMINELHPRNKLTMDLMAGVLTSDNMNLIKSLDQLGMAEGVAEGGSTYSLFSGAQEQAGWGGPRPALSQAQQSLWSGPGPSPLERLLEQQKQLKQAPGEPQ